MSNRINEIMQLNGSGYIEEYDDIAVIIEKLKLFDLKQISCILCCVH